MKRNKEIKPKPAAGDVIKLNLKTKSCISFWPSTPPTLIKTIFWLQWSIVIIKITKQFPTHTNIKKGARKMSRKVSFGGGLGLHWLPAPECRRLYCGRKKEKERKKRDQTGPCHHGIGDATITWKNEEPKIKALLQLLHRPSSTVVQHSHLKRLNHMER